MSLVLNKWALFLLCFVLISGSERFAAAQASPVGENKVSDPVVVNFRADNPSRDIGSFIEAVKAERAKGPDELNVQLIRGPILNILPEPRERDNVNVYPDPLLLTVEVDAKGNLELNFEKLGSLANFAPITKRLVGIFKAREDNGVIRPGKNEIEKTVSLRLAPVLKVSDLEKVAKAVEDAGSDQINLLIDPPDTEIILDTSLLPPEPRPKRKRLRRH